MQNGDETERIHYSVQIVPDQAAGTGRYFSVSLKVFLIFLTAAAFLVIAALLGCFILAGELSHADRDVETYKNRAEELERQNGELLTTQREVMRENEELQEKVEILSDTINGKVQQEREAALAQACIPTGYPLQGKASYSESETKLDGNPIAYFQASRGTSVVATANGTVSSVVSDGAAGYIVMVDHGNGYVSVYRNSAHPKVEEGDAVTNTTELFDIETGNEVLGYQIIQNECYIDPLSLMETYG